MSHFKCQNILGPFFNCNIVVTFTQVEFAEKYYTNCVFKDDGDVWEGADILDYDGIDFPVVKQGPEGAVLLFIIEDWGAIG